MLGNKLEMDWSELEVMLRNRLETERVLSFARMLLCAATVYFSEPYSEEDLLYQRWDAGQESSMHLFCGHPEYRNSLVIRVDWQAQIDINPIDVFPTLPYRAGDFALKIDKRLWFNEEAHKRVARMHLKYFKDRCWPRIEILERHK